MRDGERGRHIVPTHEGPEETKRKYNILTEILSSSSTTTSAHVADADR
jgi:hypothetical protein